MNTIIRVETSIEGYETKMTGARDAYEELDTVFSSIATALNQSGKWSGEKRDKCQQIHGLMAQYKDSIRPLIIDLESSIKDFVQKADAFAVESGCVGTLKNRW